MGLLLRSLRHHAPAHLAAAAGVAAATAAIVAALLVGAAMRDGLQHRALQRLGPITHVVAPPHGLALATAQAGAAQTKDLAAGGWFATAVLAADGTCSEAEGEATLPRVRLIGVEQSWAFLRGGQTMPDGDRCLVSRAVADALALHPGSEVVLAVERVRAAADGTLFAQHRRDRRIATLRTVVADIVEPHGVGQVAPWRDLPPGPLHAVWLERSRLAAAVGTPEAVSDLLVAGWDPLPLVTALRTAATPADLGLRLRAAGGIVRVEAVDLLLDPAVAAALPEARRSSLYLADRLACGTRSASYAMVASLDPFPAGAVAPSEDGIVLDRWLADDLQAAVGDQVELALPVPDGAGGYPLTQVSLRVEGVVATGGPWTDRDLVPLLPGITDADDLAHWDAPFPVDLTRVTPRDDQWWEQHRAAPKAFVHPRCMELIWSAAGGRGRHLTGLDLAGDVASVSQRLVAALAPSYAGFAAQPVREQALAAATGSTDLGGLFLGLGFFIVAAGLGLTAVVMRLGLVRRASEAGTLRACGWTAMAVRRLHAAEGALTACLGAVVGALLGVALAALLLGLLAGPWAAAGGGVSLRLRWDATAILVGCAAGAGLGVLTAWWAGGLLVRRGILDLLAGWRAERLRRPPAAFRRSQPLTLWWLLLRSLAAAPWRAVASLGLAACACFVLVMVAAQRRQALPSRALDGGFDLIVETTLPPGYDPAVAEGRRRLGFADAEQALFTRAVGLLVAPGDGISCLQPDKPLRPRLVGWPAELRDWPAPTGGWTVLDATGEDIPAVGDADSTQWILHAPVGTRLPYDTGHLRISGVLPAGSILAGDLLVAPERLRQLRPDAARTRWLVSSPDPAAAALVLRRRLAPYGVEVTSTASAIAAVGAVRTAYLDAFLALGGVGLGFAVLGVAALVLRSAEERRWEGALLTALGLARRRWAILLAGEQALLLVTGMALGSTVALLASLPALTAPGAAVAWPAVTLVLGGVLLLGALLALLAGWWGARRTPARTLAAER